MLLLTLALSLVLHVLLVMRYSGLDWARDTDETSAPLKVKLEPLPKPPTVVAENEPPPEIKPKPEAKPKPKSEPEPTLPLEAPPPVEETVVADSSETIPEQPPVTANWPTETPVLTSNFATYDGLPMMQEGQVDHVEIDFAIKRGSISSTARQVYDRDGSRYVLISEVKLPWPFSDIEQSSSGNVTAQGLQPTLFSYAQGKKGREAAFDWEHNILTLKYGEEKKQAASPFSIGGQQDLASGGMRNKQVPLSEGAQDFISFMYQFMFMPPLAQMQLTITDGRRLKTYDYTFEGEEIIEFPFGRMNSLRIMYTGSKGEEKTELWLVPDYHYLPLRFRMTEEDGTTVELVATQVKIQ
ncbi:MAG: DUF3108 domain-containing protein [Methylobacillus sp.]|nr:DUF3108 domain-containing protein [Methylobacillus sp.]